MRLLVAIAALVLGVSAHAQQGANTEPGDPATKARVRVEGAAVASPQEQEGGASLGATGVNPPAPRTGMPPRPGDDMPPRPGDYARPDTQPANAEPADPAEKARVRVEGAAGGTGARVPEEASGGTTAGAGSQHRHSLP
jgi:hypothetical protein